MKTLLTTIVICLCLLQAPLPARGAEDAGPSVFFFSPVHLEGRHFWTLFTEFMEVAARDLGIDLTIVPCKHRFDVLEQARRALKGGKAPDYVVFIYQVSTSSDMLAMLEKAGVKSVVCNTDVIESEKRLVGRPGEKYKHWIGHLFPDDHQAGFELARRLIDRGFELGLTDEKGDLHMAAIGGTLSAASGIDRKRGMEMAVATHGNVILDRYVRADWLREKARYKTSLMLSMYPLAKVFWAVHDGTALGVLDAAEENGLRPSADFVTGGIGWSSDGIRAVREGRMEATLGGHFMEGAWALLMILDHENGCNRSVAERIQRSRMRIIDRDNLDEYQAILTPANWAKIDFKRFSKTYNPDLEEYDFTPEAVVRQLNGG